MWPLPRISNEIVAITFYPDSVSLAWFKKVDEKIRYRLQAYQSLTFDQPIALLVPMRLQQPINEFLHANQLRGADGIFCLGSPSIIEKVVTLPTQTPEATQFEEQELQSMIWDYQLLYQQDYEHWAYYLSCIHPQLLFQYKLLALHCNLNVRTIIPRFMANLFAYRASKGNVYSQERFGDHMMTQKNNISSLTTIEDLASLVAIDPHVSLRSPRDISMIKELVGLAVAGEQHEAY